MNVALITDWQARLRSRVFEQFKNSAWAYPLANAIGAGANQLELAFAAFLAIYSIDPVTSDSTSPLYGVGRGVQLDRIGRLVGQPRGAATDAIYRLILRARILVNRSHGSPDQIIAIGKAMFGGFGEPLILPGWIAEYTVRLVGVSVDPLEVDSVVALIREATQAGTRVVVEWTSGTLTWDGLDADEGIGALIPGVAGVAATGFVDDSAVAGWIDGDGIGIADAQGRTLVVYFNDTSTFTPPPNTSTLFFQQYVATFDGTFGGQFRDAMNAAGILAVTPTKISAFRTGLVGTITGAAGNIAITTHNYATDGPISDGGWLKLGMSGGVTAVVESLIAGGMTGGAR